VPLHSTRLDGRRDPTFSGVAASKFSDGDRDRPFPQPVPRP
jgi:hypothetical protein